MVLSALLERPAVREAVRNYVRTRVPWLDGYCKTQLGLVPGYPLALGGIPWCDRRNGALGLADKKLAETVHLSSKNLTTAVICETDLLSRQAARCATANVSVAKKYRDVYDLGWFSAPPAPAHSLNRLIVDFVGGELMEEHELFSEEVQKTTSGIAFTSPHPESGLSSRSYRLTADRFRRTLEKIRGEGLRGWSPEVDYLQ